MGAKDEAVATEARRAKEIEETLIFMALYEKHGLNVPEPRFFDGAVPAWGSIIENLFRYGKGDGAVNEWANLLDRIGGAVVCAPEPEDGPAVRFVLCGARELNYMERLKAAPRLNAYSQGIRRPRPGAVFRHGDRFHGETRISAERHRMVQVREVLVMEDGRAVGRHKDVFVGHDGKWSPTFCSAIHIGFALSVYSCVAAESQWRVAIRLSHDCPSVSLFTDPIGVRDFFRFRDIPEGKSRRDALLHWVSEHHRQSRDDPEVETMVREHLRGQRAFQWNGMGVEILLPRSEVAREQASISARKSMRLRKADRRRRGA